MYLLVTFSTNGEIRNESEQRVSTYSGISWIVAEERNIQGGMLMKGVCTT